MQNEVGNPTEEQGKEADGEGKRTVERVESEVRGRGRGNRQMSRPGGVCLSTLPPFPRPWFGPWVD